MNMEERVLSVRSVREVEKRGRHVSASCLGSVFHYEPFTMSLQVTVLAPTNTIIHGKARVDGSGTKFPGRLGIKSG